MYTEGGGCPSKGVGYLSHLELERKKVLIQENKQAAPHQVIGTFTVPHYDLVTNTCTEHAAASHPINFITANAFQLLLSG